MININSMDLLFVNFALCLINTKQGMREIFRSNLLVYASFVHLSMNTLLLYAFQVGPNVLILSKTCKF